MQYSAKIKNIGNKSFHLLLDIDNHQLCLDITKEFELKKWEKVLRDMKERVQDNEEISLQLEGEWFIAIKNAKILLYVYGFLKDYSFRDIIPLFEDIINEIKMHKSIKTTRTAMLKIAQDESKNIKADLLINEANKYWSLNVNNHLDPKKWKNLIRKIEGSDEFKNSQLNILEESWFLKISKGEITLCNREDEIDFIHCGFSDSLRLLNCIYNQMNQYELLKNISQK